MARVGVAGWSVPATLSDRFQDGGSHLERYASRFDAVEINSSFYRPHRRATYARWAASVPFGFRFAVKLPRSITHERRFVDCADLLARFADEVGGLGAKRGPVLVQLPPSFSFAADLANGFFAQLGSLVGGALVCEPRHASWFETMADAMLCRHRVGRVAADPAPVAAAAHTGGWGGLAYTRLHGSPRIYWSAYDAAAIQAQARRIKERAARKAEVWTIYDNTAAGAAPADALKLLARLTSMVEYQQPVGPEVI